MKTIISLLILLNAYNSFAQNTPVKNNQYGFNEIFFASLTSLDKNADPKLYEVVFNIKSSKTDIVNFESTENGKQLINNFICICKDDKKFAFSPSDLISASKNLVELFGLGGGYSKKEDRTAYDRGTYYKAVKVIAYKACNDICFDTALYDIHNYCTIDLETSKLDCSNTFKPKPKPRTH